MFGHFLYYTQIARGPSQHKSGFLTASMTQHPKAKHESHLPMCEPLCPYHHLVRATPKATWNPSEATAVFAGRVHLGPRRDQLLDHGGLAVPSRRMQRRLASAPRMRRGRRGSCGCRRKTKLFLQVVGQNSEKHIRSAKLMLFACFSVRHGEKQEEQSSQNMFLLYRVV